jgi:phospholipid N-methyltransferase
MIKVKKKINFIKKHKKKNSQVNSIIPLSKMSHNNTTKNIKQTTKLKTQNLMLKNKNK